ncbi:MAG: CDP-alcohol phosphatidyltransferase family protein [Chitinophagales bacterium]|nr:CDP-alcohol phosphatidyltransferase family protein [Chitinophagales bacterium]
MAFSLKRYIPNTLTLTNLLCGCFAIFSLFMDRTNLVLPFIIIAMFADFFDGMIARLLNVKTPIGKDLDSLADVVSFGVVPSFLMIYLVVLAHPINNTNNFIDELKSINSLQTYLVIFFPLIIALFSALRLAKFNISTNQSSEFKGLATPACTVFVLGLFHNYIAGNEYFNFIYKPLVLNIISLILALLLVSNIPMFSFKVGSLSVKENPFQITFILLGIILLMMFNLSGLPLIVLLYIILNLFKNLIKR